MDRSAYLADRTRSNHLANLLGNNRRLPPGPPGGFREYSSDDESASDGHKAVVVDGKTRIVVNMKQTDQVDGITNGDAGDPEPEPIDPKDVGMTLGFKNLYNGKEDRHGRFQWQDDMPKDLGKPAEDAATAKWALIVRNRRVYNDPRRVLAIHSIVVQSPMLKKLLKRVLKDYPGVTTGLQRLELSGRFEPLIHRWSELDAAVAQLSDQSEAEKETKQHAELLQSILRKEFKTLIDESQDLLRNRVITYDYLWTIFVPGQLIYTRQDGQDVALKLINTRYGIDRKQNPCFCRFWIFRSLLKLMLTSQGSPENMSIGADRSGAPPS